MISNLFLGTDSYGRNFQVAVKDNKWYYRHYGYNGWGNGWSKWESLNETFEVYINGSGKEYIKWGWNEFVGSANNKLRIK